MERTNKFVGGALPSSFESPNDQGREQAKSGQPNSSSGRGASYNPDRKQAYPRRRKGVRTDLTLIKGILSKALAGKGIDKKIERYEFVLHWENIVGQKLAEVTKPEYISRKTLIVRVLHPVWAQECAFMKAQLLRKLAPYLKRGDVVEDMIFRVGSLAE